jgi:NAD(P)-dependent dehydrogenase (short-subunit alcohol dehydrogenase family)
VVIADVDLPAAQSFAASLPNRRAVELECDVTQIDSLNDAVRRTHEQFERIDVAIANAGVMGRGSTFRTLTPDHVGVSCPST